MSFVCLDRVLPGFQPETSTEFRICKFGYGIKIELRNELRLTFTSHTTIDGYRTPLGGARRPTLFLGSSDYRGHRDSFTDAKEESIDQRLRRIRQFKLSLTYCLKEPTGPL